MEIKKEEIRLINAVNNMYQWAYVLKEIRMNRVNSKLCEFLIYLQI